MKRLFFVIAALSVGFSAHAARLVSFDCIEAAFTGNAPERVSPNRITVRMNSEYVEFSFPEWGVSDYKIPSSIREEGAGDQGGAVYDLYKNNTDFFWYNRGASTPDMTHRVKRIYVSNGMERAVNSGVDSNGNMRITYSNEDWRSEWTRPYRCRVR